MKAQIFHEPTTYFGTVAMYEKINAFLEKIEFISAVQSSDQAYTILTIFYRD